MAMSDPLADMLTRIRNGQMARLLEVTSPASKLRANVLNVLKDEGYIRDFEHLEVEVGKPELKIQLKYYDGKPVIKNIERVSCPGRRVYSGIKELPKTLIEAIDAFASDPLSEKVLGTDLVQSYSSLKTQEWWDYFNQITTWELDAYLTKF